MAAAWFALLAFMLTMYVVLDGFDLGAGILHLFVADTDDERRTVLAAIGPIWDGNEVWLIAAGGLLVFAFPRVYAAAMSGFYLPLVMVLWLLVGRGLSIELRSHHRHALWRQFFDVGFAGSSALLAFVLGVALGNVLRGVPIDGTGYFSGALFFAADGELGALDGYTVSVGVFAVVVLAAHAAMFLRWKTVGPVAERATRWARPLWFAVVVLGVGVSIETAFVRPELLAALAARPLLWVAPAAVVVAWVVAVREPRELRGFLASCGVVAALLVLCAGALFPHLLRSTTGAAYSLTVDNAANDDHGLAIGLCWWIPAIALAVGYVVYVFRAFRGKAELPPDEH